MTRSACRLWALFLFVSALMVTDAAAQRTPSRSRFWLELGFGPGAARVGCGGCEGVTTSGGSSGLLRLGGSITDNVLLGVESFSLQDDAFSLTEDDPDVVSENSSLVAVVLWYPWHGRFFLKGGVGVADGRFTVQPETGPPVVAEGEGVSLTFGIGYDLPLSRRFALTANLGAYITAIGDITVPSGVVDDVIPTLYQFGIGFTFR